MASLPTPSVYTLKISLLGTDPVVWRRVALRGDIGLEDLHYVIQIAMGWTNSHLHRFVVGKERYGEPDPDFGATMNNERDFSLAEIAPRKGAKFRYEYDFGDSWMHEIKIEKIEPGAPDHRHPVLIDGARNCPPEDVGGIWGYRELLEASADPGHERHEEFLDWLGEPFDPEFFDPKDVSKQLKSLKYRR